MHPQRRKSVFAFGRASLGYCRDKAVTCSANGGLGECANYISIPTWVAISRICARWRWYSIGQRLNWSRSPESKMIDARERAMHGTRTTFQHRQTKIGNEEFENWLLRLLSPRIEFRIHEGQVSGNPVVLLEIQPASHQPVSFTGIEYIRVGTYKKKLKEY